MEWKVKIDDVEYVAASTEMLQDWCRSGRVRSDSYVFHPVLQRWMYANEVSELRQPATTSTPERKTGGTSFGKIALGVGCGVVLAVLLMLGMCSMCVGKVALDMDKAKKDKAAALSNVTIEDLNEKTSYGYATVTGRVHNLGATPVKFVKVEVEFLNDSGAVVDKGYTYAVSSEPLGPGEAKSFTVMQRDSKAWSSYRAHVLTE